MSATTLSPDQEIFTIGLMCGTSIDGVDVALVKFGQDRINEGRINEDQISQDKNGHDKCELIEHYLHPIATSIKQDLRLLCTLADNSAQSIEHKAHRIELLGKLDHQMGHVFAESVNALLERSGIPKEKITAIGSHGQTIRHQPSAEFPFTMQIGDPNLIASLTGIQTVADFRRMDMAVGGQGAPLAPAFHNAVMRSTRQNRIILNLGGIANITLLPQSTDAPVIGFDTGTANTLLDAWFICQHPNATNDFDKDAAFARSGQVSNELLQSLLADPYFTKPYPKSTGREYFSIDWLQGHLSQIDISPQDVQRTLLEFSAVTIAEAIQALNLNDFQVYASGGGAHNGLLMQSIAHHLGRAILTTDDIGINGDYLEAMTFAWLAKQRVQAIPANLPEVTGAKTRKILGAIYLP